MTQYYAFYPRNFANEYTVYGAESTEAASVADKQIEFWTDNINASFERITRKAAERMANRYYSVDDLLAAGLPIPAVCVEADCCMRDYTGRKLKPGTDF